jgi:cyclopropane fatty-acyl-phospholipid synthase-like methyltransferase
MQERHSNRKRYFNEQGLTTAKYVIPYISDLIAITPETTVLEIGCGEAGNLKPFLDMGCRCVGIDISEGRKEIFCRSSTF